MKLKFDNSSADNIKLSEIYSIDAKVLAFEFDSETAMQYHVQSFYILDNHC